MGAKEAEEAYIAAGAVLPVHPSTQPQDGDMLLYDADTQQWVPVAPVPVGAVASVNTQTGAVVLDATDVGAVPEMVATAKGDVLAATGTGVFDAVPVGADGTVLLAASGEDAGVRFGYVSETRLTAPDDTVYRLVVANDGTVSTEVVP